MTTQYCSERLVKECCAACQHGATPKFQDRAMTPSRRGEQKMLSPSVSGRHFSRASRFPADDEGHGRCSPGDIAIAPSAPGYSIMLCEDCSSAPRRHERGEAYIACPTTQAERQRAGLSLQGWPKRAEGQDGRPLDQGFRERQAPAPPRFAWPSPKNSASRNLPPPQRADDGWRSTQPSASVPASGCCARRRAHADTLERSRCGERGRSGRVNTASTLYA